MHNPRELWIRKGLLKIQALILQFALKLEPQRHGGHRGPQRKSPPLSEAQGRWSKSDFKEQDTEKP